MSRVRWFLLLSACAADPDVDSTVSPFGVDNPPHGVEPVTERLFQEELPPLDVLMVVDNSSCFQEEQGKIAAAFPSLLAHLELLADWHLGIVTTDMWAPGQQGRLQGDPAWLSPLTPDLQQAYTDRVRIGGSGAIDEEMFRPMTTALTRPLSEGDNAGFRRADADLMLIVTTDEDDVRFSITPESVAATLRAQAPTVSLHVLSGLDEGCPTANASVRVMQLQERIPGEQGDVCGQQGAYDDFFDRVGQSIRASPAAFPLEAHALPGTVAVSIVEPSGQVIEARDAIYGEPCATCYSFVYDESASVLHIEPAPTSRAEIRVTYVPRR